VPPPLREIKTTPIENLCAVVVIVKKNYYKKTYKDKNFVAEFSRKLTSSQKEYFQNLRKEIFDIKNRDEWSNWIQFITKIQNLLVEDDNYTKMQMSKTTGISKLFEDIFKQNFNLNQELKNSNFYLQLKT